jgi:tetratricopeptide (TPR) repeat protein
VIRWLPLAAALAVCGLSLGGSFVFDDHALFADPAITDPAGWRDCFAPAQTRPLTWLSFWASYQIGGRAPLPWHAVSLALHLACVWLLARTLEQPLGSRAALAAALAFAVHPLNAQAVNYVFARSTLLMTLGCLASLRAWLAGRPVAAAAWYGGALLAKEECAAFPFFLMLLDAARGRQIRWRPLAAMLTLTAALGLRAVWATRVTPGAGSGFGAGISPLDYFLTQSSVILRYTGQLAVPVGLSVDPEIARPGAALGLALWFLLAALALALWRMRRRGELVWLLGGWLLLLPSSSFLPASDLAADRRMYLPLVSFSAAFGLLTLHIRARALAIPLVWWAALGWQQTRLWSAPAALWQEAVRLAPGKIRPRIQLARLQPPEAALATLAAAKKIAPDDPSVASEEGRIYLDIGRPEMALEAFGRALAADPGSARALNNRGVALFALAQIEAARADFERALAVEPCQFDARANLRKLGVVTAAPQQCRFTPEQRAILGKEDLRGDDH